MIGELTPGSRTTGGVVFLAVAVLLSMFFWQAAVVLLGVLAGVSILAIVLLRRAGSPVPLWPFQLVVGIGVVTIAATLLVDPRIAQLVVGVLAAVGLGRFGFDKIQARRSTA